MAMEPAPGVPLGPKDSLPADRMTIVEVDGAEVGVLRVGGEVVAFENRCPHQGGPVCYGDVLGLQEAILDERRRVVGGRFSPERLTVVCPWHGWTFDAATGRSIGDRRRRLIPWRVVEREGMVFLAGRQSQAGGSGPAESGGGEPWA